jgi:squalene-hopene/tetraprenyl-beta-curcumene cyclase
VEDTVAHAVSALRRFRLEPAHYHTAVTWLTEQFERRGRWVASWYRSHPYAVLEIGNAVGIQTNVTRRAVRLLEQEQNDDGGWGAMPGEPSIASATGLALAALLPHRTPSSRVVVRGAEFLIKAQREDGTWLGLPEMYGPRPLLSHLQTHTHAFATRGLIALWTRTLHRP